MKSQNSNSSTSSGTVPEPISMVLFWKNPKATKNSASFAGNDVLKRFLQSGDELMTIVGPEDGSCVCGDWVGAVVSVSGTSDQWPPLLDALEDGVFHEGCQHRLERYSTENRIEAEFCTGLAVAAMKARAQDSVANPLPSKTPANPRIKCQQEFSKLYNAALLADETGAIDSALSKCEATLEMLHRQDVFGADQDQVEQVLEARIRGIVSQLRSRNTNPEQ